ncbi:hypothetical protein ACIQWA_07810 [Kitasatospora sp. NPDC098652]|uniref:helix-turn-helix transcriptional regulator n=1 Tax=Kitasatospora sp. NPDC098652 TaxID=3364095 RepID=UPI0037F7260D
MNTALPPHALSERETRLLGHLAAEAQPRTITVDPILALAPADVDEAVRALLSTTGTRTVPQLVAWGAAHSIVTGPHTPPTTDFRLPGRLQRILQGWVGGRTAPELAADLDVTPHTVREYDRGLRVRLGVRTQIQASITAVLAGLVLLRDIKPDWPAEPFRHAAPAGKQTA